MIVDGQCYIVWVPGMETLDKLPDGCQVRSERRGMWVADTCNPRQWVIGTYRYPVTETEYKTHHWCIAHDVNVPDGYEVVGFGKPKLSEYYFTSYVSSNVTQKFNEITLGYKGPILRKIVCEHKNTGKFFEPGGFYIKCADCGMVRKLGDWEKSE